MAGTNAEIIRRSLEAWAAGDGAKLLEDLDPSIRVYPRPHEPDAEREYTGFDGLGRYLQNWFGGWESYEFDVKEVSAAGDDSVLVVLSEHGRTASGFELDEDFTHS